MQSKAYLPSLTGLRGFASVLVFWYHARWQAGDPSILLGTIELRDVLQACDGGVGIFFVLSGFLLSRPYWQNLLEREPRPIALQPYLIRRITRIAPAYFLALFHTHLFSPVTYTFWGIVSLLLYLVGLHTFFHQAYEWGANPVLWSIGIELQFYIILPLFFWLVLKISGTKYKRGITGLCIITVLCFILDPIYKAVALTLAPHLPATILGGNDAIDSPVINLSIFYYLKWFWIGILYAWIDKIYAVRFIKYQTGSKSYIIFDAIMAVGLLGMCWILFNASEGEWRSLSLYGWPINCLFFGYLVIASPHSYVGRWLFNNKAMTFIGEISYGIYLWHWLVQVVVFKGSLPNYFKDAHLLLIGGGVSFLITVILASLSYFFLERPAIALGHRCKSFPELWYELRLLFQFS